jgi:hypothetical protein
MASPLPNTNAPALRSYALLLDRLPWYHHFSNALKRTSRGRRAPIAKLVLQCSSCLEPCKSGCFSFWGLLNMRFSGIFHVAFWNRVIRRRPLYVLSFRDADCLLEKSSLGNPKTAGLIKTVMDRIGGSRQHYASKSRPVCIAVRFWRATTQAGSARLST